MATACCPPPTCCGWRASCGRVSRAASWAPKQGNHKVVPTNDAASERADRKITQPQIGEQAAFPQAEQAPVQSETQGLVAAPDRDADAFAEVTALRERAALEHAACSRIGAVEPEGKRDAVAEQEIDVAAAQRFTRGFPVGIGKHFHLGEEGAQIR